MYKIISILISVFIISNISFAQNKGSMSLKQIEEIKTKVKNEEAFKAKVNAISNNKISKIALNRSTQGKIDHSFKYKVKVKGITDQNSSGRCWMFTGLNVLRPKMIDKQNLSSFEFSTNYLYFYDMLEKSNLFLEGVIKSRNKKMEEQFVTWLFKNPVNDGGVWNSLTNLVAKYGVVPKEVMPETYHSDNTRDLNRFMKRKLREDGIIIREMAAYKKSEKDIRAKKNEMLIDVYKILAFTLGEPPTEFNYRFIDKENNIGETKKYTPQSFYKELINVNLEEYVMLMDDPTREYYKLYEIDNDRNVLEGRNWIYINLPSEEIKKFAISSIIDNEAMYFSCDVGKQLEKNSGTLDLDNYDYESLFGMTFGMNKKQRVKSFESGSSHGMALVGVDIDKNDKPTMWLLENSWGSSYGHNGYLTMTDDWFDEYMFRVVINKKFIDNKTLKILNQKPTILPPWDPMFMFDK